jgi:putative two-component system response regulator
MNSKILIVDDLPENRKLLASLLSKTTKYEIFTAQSGADVIEMMQDKDFPKPDLILLDIMMPEMNGFDIIKVLKEMNITKDIPIIFITALADTENIIQSFELGGADYITKPFNRHELLARINTQLALKNLLDELKFKNTILQDREVHLTKLVEEKTKKVEGITLALVNALENVNHLNDSDTGFHIQRVSKYSVILAEGYGCDHDFVKKIGLYSSLHDIGKVGIPDSILKKIGKYSDNEYEKMKEHVHIGAKMLESSDLDAMAKNIALYHHERWNGEGGYPKKLKGEAIPLEARIVALADVYDALSSKRSYKDPFEEAKIDDIIRNESGTHFDPRLVEVFFQQKGRLLQVKKELQ